MLSLKLGTGKKETYLECDQVERNEEYQSWERILMYRFLSCNSRGFHWKMQCE